MSRTCDACGGSGQLQTFKGESRFLLTVEECPHCAGLGSLLPQDTEEGTGQKLTPRSRPAPRKRNKKK